MSLTLSIGDSAFGSSCSAVYVSKGVTYEYSSILLNYS